VSANVGLQEKLELRRQGTVAKGCGVLDRRGFILIQLGARRGPRMMMVAGARSVVLSEVTPRLYGSSAPAPGGRWPGAGAAAARAACVCAYVLELDVG